MSFLIFCLCHGSLLIGKGQSQTRHPRTRQAVLRNRNFWDLDFLRNKSNRYGKYVSKAINTRLRLPSLMSLGKLFFCLIVVSDPELDPDWEIMRRKDGSGTEYRTYYFNISFTLFLIITSHFCENRAISSPVRYLNGTVGNVIFYKSKRALQRCSEINRNRRMYGI